MIIQVCGVSHKTAPVEVREKISFSPERLGEALVRPIRLGIADECVILSTCNRVEIYAVKSKKHTSHSLAEFLCEFHKIDKNIINKYLYYYDDLRAVEHLFRVVSGLESMVLGESQIGGQVKRAYQAARDAGCTGNVFDGIFSEAIKVGKDARNSTKIGEGLISISSVAVDLIKKIFIDLGEKKVLIIGAGKIGELTFRHLVGSGVKKVFVVNRTYEIAEKIAKELGGTALNFSELHNRLKEIDIVISSTSAPHAVICKDTISCIMKERSLKPLFLIDIAVPRNVDRLVCEIDNVHLYDIDDLNKVKDCNLKARMKEAKKVEFIIKNKLKRLSSQIDTWSQSVLREPGIVRGEAIYGR